MLQTLYIIPLYVSAEKYPLIKRVYCVVGRPQISFLPLKTSNYFEWRIKTVTVQIDVTKSNNRI